MFKWLKELKLFDYVLIILIALLSIVFAVITLKDEKPNNNEVNGSLNLSTYQVNDIVNLASPDLTYNEYLGNGEYLLLNDNTLNGTMTYNVYSGVFTINGTFREGYQTFTINSTILFNGDYYISRYFISGTATNYNVGAFEVYAVNKVLLNGSLSSYQGYYQNLNDSGLRFVNNGTPEITYSNLQFKLQIEKGTTATPYQTPIGALEQHEQFIYDKGYDLGLEHGYYFGYDDGYDLGIEHGIDYGYVDGFDDGLMSVLQVRDYLGYSNLDNIIFLERNQIGPNDRFFGFKIENVDTYIENLTFFSTMLTNSDYFAPLNELSSGSRAGITLNYSDSDFVFYSFADMANIDDEYSFHNMRKENKVEYITVRFLLKANLPGFDFPSFQQSLFQNISLFINDQYFNDLFIKRITDIYYDKGLKDGVSQGLDDGYWDGYDDGLVDNPNNNFGSLITTILLGVGTVLGIELLPNITIGAIIAVPIVFGIIAFVLGRKKE